MVVTLDRPEKRNAIDADTGRGAARGVRRSGAGAEAAAAHRRHRRHLRRRRGHRAVARAGPPRRAWPPSTRAFARIRALPLPTVAAIDGPALGGGAELAYACDLRVCTARAFFGQPEVRLGIIAGAGATYRLPALVGEARAKELLFTGRRVDAEEALRIGLVNRVVADAGGAAARRARAARRDRPGVAAGAAADEAGRGRPSRRAPAARPGQPGGAVRGRGEAPPDDRVPVPQALSGRHEQARAPPEGSRRQSCILIPPSISVVITWLDSSNPRITTPSGANSLTRSARPVRTGASWAVAPGW